jgi:hypothetical protein
VAVGDAESGVLMENEDEAEESGTDKCDTIGWMERLSELFELFGKAIVEDEVTV